MQHFVVLAIAFGSFIAGAYAQSNPAACWACPPMDQLGFALGVTNYNTDPIFCSYPAILGEDPNDFFCTYSATTGLLVEDQDDSLCEPSAISLCTRKKREVLPRSPVSTRNGVRSEKPRVMQTIQKLGAAKRRERTQS